MLLLQMRMKMLDPLLLLLLAFMAIVTPPPAQGQDVVCGRKTNKTVLVDVGDSFSFKTQAGRKYRPNSKCDVRYTKSPTCSSMRFSCSKFSIKNRKSSCKKESGDRMVVVTDGKAKRFCQGKPPNITTSEDLRVVFLSNKGKQSTGAECLVQCQETIATTGLNLLFLGPGDGSSGQSEVFLTSEKSGLTPATCQVPEYPITNISRSVVFIYEDYLHICGGYSRSSSNKYPAECYSLRNSAWSPTSSMLSRRSSAAVVRMHNGSVLVSGGWNGSSLLQSSELLTGSTWSPAMQLPSPINGHCMLQLSSGEIFLHGGYSQGAVSDTHISQDHVSWEKVMSSKTARYLHACTEVTINSKQQVWVGGWKSSRSSEIFVQLVDGTWTWTDGPDLPNRSPGQFVGYNGDLFYAGDYNNKNIYQLKDGWRTQEDAWTLIGVMTQRRHIGFTAMMITEDICKGEKPTPPTATTTTSPTVQNAASIPQSENEEEV